MDSKHVPTVKEDTRRTNHQKNSTDNTKNVDIFKEPPPTNEPRYEQTMSRLKTIGKYMDILTSNKVEVILKAIKDNKDEEPDIFILLVEKLQLLKYDKIPEIIGGINHNLLTYKKGFENDTDIRAWAGFVSLYCKLDVETFLKGWLLNKQIHICDTIDTNMFRMKRFLKYCYELDWYLMEMLTEQIKVPYIYRKILTITNKNTIQRLHHAGIFLDADDNSIRDCQLTVEPFLFDYYTNKN
jgi:hypothetical protein